MNLKNNKKTKIILFLGLIVIILATISFLLFLNDRQPETVIDSSPFFDESGRLVVTASLFPVYDFAKVVGGDKVSVSLILPPGIEAHSFTLDSNNLLSIQKSALFFYTSAIMEPWAAGLKNEVSAKTQVVPIADGLNTDNLDPHVWLDFTKASQMVDTVLTVYQKVDPQNYSYYKNNADAYKKKLEELDSQFASGLKDCQFREFISGGHFTFAYLANRYNLKYQAAGGFTPDLKPNSEKIVALGKELKSSGQPYVYYEEMLMPYVSEILRQASGAQLMPLNAAHNVGKYDIAGGLTFISLMEGNLKILKKGLICR